MSTGRGLISTECPATPVALGTPPSGSSAMRRETPKGASEERRCNRHLCREKVSRAPSFSSGPGCSGSER